MLEPGSYSSGTMRPEDLIPTFMGALESVDKPRAMKLIKEYADVFDYLEEDGEEVQDDMDFLLNEELFGALNDYCPEGYYFGASEGDGADYGVWPVDPAWLD